MFGAKPSAHVGTQPSAPQGLLDFNAIARGLAGPAAAPPQMIMPRPSFNPNRPPMAGERGMSGGGRVPNMFPGLATRNMFGTPAPTVGGGRLMLPIDFLNAFTRHV